MVDRRRTMERKKRISAIARMAGMNESDGHFALFAGLDDVDLFRGAITHRCFVAQSQRRESRRPRWKLQFERSGEPFKPV
jgi:hypothetical protein